jgi:hypothetical protein
MDNFNAVELDLIIRGLFALQKLQPSESAVIQQLINKVANTVYQVDKRREWVGLTDEEIKDIVGRNDPGGIGSYTRDLFKKIEDKLKEKNT